MNTPATTSVVPAGSNPADQPTMIEFGRALRAQLATITGGLAPEAYTQAWWDWFLNIGKQPARQQELLQDALAKSADTWAFAWRAAGGAAVPPVEGDSRFADPAWSQWPFNVYARGYLNTVDWWKAALAPLPGVAPEHARSLKFLAETTSEALSPSNFLATNPELLETTRAEAGANLVRGFGNWLEDVRRTLENGKPGGAEVFVPGRDVAATPGKVVLRNELVELIQYSPATDTVYAEPVLIVPAWIMKYYILDLSPHNSLVRYLVSQGHTVFILSWKNPTAADRALGMDDYVNLGVRAAVDAVAQIVPARPIHAVGYCIGGTLLSIAAADLAAQDDRRLGSITLLAAQQDFSEPGELSVFITPAQLDMLEAVMDRAGVLTSEQMSGAFVLLRSRDLLWTPAVNQYLRGKRDSVNDLMAWNADGTRMPCRMHTQYLRQLYMNNELARGTFRVESRTIDLKSITVPMFVVGTETDHVAPWRSVYKARDLTRSADYTFLLTSGGHNAGIVSGPAHPRRRHRVRSWSNAADTLPAQDWFDTTPPQAGSWWPVWEEWLARHSTAARVAPPALGSQAHPPLADAPGDYVTH